MNTEGFEVFHSVNSSAANGAPTIAIQASGVFSVSLPAYQLLGSPARVKLLFNPETEQVAMAATADDAPYSFRVRRTNGRAVHVAGTAFFAHYGIDWSKTRRWPARMLDSGLLAINLKDTSEVITSNRKKKST